MSVKTNTIIALLKQTSTGSTTKEAVAKETNIPEHVINKILHEFREIGAIEYENEPIELTSNQRVKLAIHAINQGTDIEKVCKVLEWKEFENFTATAFKTNNFATQRNFRFKASQRRWEIDVLAISEPIIVCVDCKRWRRGWGNSAINKIVDLQTQRTQLLAANLNSLQRKINISDWKQATLFPVIVSLFAGQVKFYNKVPVVPILQLQNFVDEFLGHTSELRHFRVTLDPRLPDYLD